MPVQIFWARPKIEQLNFSALPKSFVQVQKLNLLMKIIFWSGTKSLGLAQYSTQFLVWHKKFGPAQNVLGPVKGQDINSSFETLLK